MQFQRDKNTLALFCKVLLLEDTNDNFVGCVNFQEKSPKIL